MRWHSSSMIIASFDFYIILQFFLLQQLIMTDFSCVVTWGSLAIFILIVVFFIVNRSGKDQAVLTDKQQMEDGSVMLTFIMPKNKNKLGLKVGQQISIRVHKNQKAKSKQFTPIESGIGSFKILLIQSLDESSDKGQTQINQQLKNLKVKDKIWLKIVQTNIEYLGDSQIRIKKENNKTYTKKFKNVYVLAQGNKISIAYQIIRGICEQQSESTPKITVLFVGGGITDFALKNQFENLEDSFSNVKYFYSLPVKGERQPSIAGMGISSEKVAESFSTDEADTFCILCSQQNDLSVVVERALLNKKVPSEHIYKC